MARRRGSRRRHRRNPGAVGSITGSVRYGYNLGRIKKAGVMAGGAAANYYLTQYVNGFLSPYLPGALSSYSKYAVGLAGAGLVQMAGNKVRSGVGSDMADGALLQVVASAINDKTMGRYMGDFLTAGQVGRAKPMRGMGDSLTAGALRSVRPLQGFQLADYMTASDLNDIRPIQSADSIIANEFGMG
jgi:hypothetical protein